MFEQGEHQDQVKYQAAHHELVASALATRIAHEVNPANQVGCMLAGGNFYPYSCKPADVWTALQKDRENLLFIDVQARGAYPAYAQRVFRDKGVTLVKGLCSRMVSALESASVFPKISSSHLKSITSSLDFHHDHSRTC